MFWLHVFFRLGKINMDGIYSVFIHFFNDKSDVIFGNFFAFSWDMFKYIDHMSGDGIVVIGFNTAAKSFIDIIQTGGAIHQVFAGAQLLYRVYLIIVILDVYKRQILV